ncbi:MAG: methyltransferase domain-containing protein [Verrucomicrobia bacterium]|nr:methyltransferase domain-containing protein [Verrucomicrobiota bacterium]
MQTLQLDRTNAEANRSEQEAGTDTSIRASHHGPTKAKPVLHLGCGKSARTGCLNVDRIELPGVDVVWDLNRRPWPFAAGVWHDVIAHHVFEHLDDLVQSIRELHRILAPGGRAEIRVPHMAGWGAWNDITHRHFLTRRSFDYFTRGHRWNYYYDFAFSTVRCHNVFGIGRSACLNTLMNPLVNTPAYDWWLWKLIPCAEVEVLLVK